MSERSKEDHWSKLARILNSTTAFVLAFVLSMYLVFWIMGIMSTFFGVHCTVYYYGVLPIMAEVNWTKWMILFVFGAPSFFILIWGLINWYLLTNFQKYLTIANLFFLWSFIIGVAISISMFLSAILGFGEYNSPFYSFLGVVYAWLRIPIFVAYLLLILMGIFGIFISIAIVKPILRFAYSYTIVNKHSRQRLYFLETFIVPIVLGMVICLQFTLPYNVHFTAIVGFVIFVMSLIALYAIQFLSLSIDEIIRYKFLQGINVKLIILTIFVLIGVYFIRGGVNI